MSYSSFLVSSKRANGKFVQENYEEGSMGATELVPPSSLAWKRNEISKLFIWLPVPSPNENCQQFRAAANLK